MSAERRVRGQPDGPARRPVTATYRLQLRAGGLDFAAVEATLGYFAHLGVSHLYLSPVLAAAPGSTHGYDVVDPERVDDALGGADGLRALARAADAHGLGLVLDIVPNHQAAVPENPAWWRLLATGRDGPEADTFDVDWEPDLPGARGQVVLPVLGAPLGEVLAAGALTVEDDALIAHGEHRFPRPAGAAESDLAGLLAHAHYRPCHWRIGDAVVNYRRFFAIDELAAVRVEDAAVFSRVMGAVLDLVTDGTVAGLRVDHVDGLADPAGFCRALRERAPHAWLLAEKILGADEVLPDWPIDGTTGYEFLADVLGLFIDPDAEPAFTALARERGAWPADPDAAERQAKREAGTGDLAADRDRVVRALRGAAATDLAAADVTFDQARAAVIETLVRLPVYRAYAVPGAGCDAAAAALVDAAVAGARPTVADVPDHLWRLLGAALRGQRAGADAAEVCVRGQQLAAAMTAKGVEDTWLYRQHRLAALNEVGAEPTRFGTTAADFHAANAARAAAHPRSMLTTATHDTKRGEDTRLRLAALTELREAWSAAVRRWDAAHAPLVVDTPGGPAPDPATRYLTYQTLVGLWAPEPVRAPVDALAERLGDYLVKASREAGQRTSWRDPEEAFEHATVAFARALLADPGFRAELDALADPAGEIAMTASLAQVLLRATSPGVPDTYQGAEGWRDDLVDPDNRTPVDFAHAAAELAAADAADIDALLRDRADGRIKRRVLAESLRARCDHRWVATAESSYEPLAVTGRWADHVVAFARQPAHGDVLVVLAPRLPGRVMRAAADDDLAALRPPVGADWADTAVGLPAALARRPWRDRLGGPGAAGGEALALAEVLGTLPVALLESTDGAG